MKMANTKTLTPSEMREEVCNSSVDRLDSWKEIADHLNRNVRTVQRWEKFEALPIHRQFHQRSGSVHAFKSEIDGWRKSRSYRKPVDHRLSAKPPASGGFEKHSMDDPEQVILRKLLKEVLLQVASQTTHSAAILALKTHSQTADGEILTDQKDFGSRRGNADGNNVQSRSFLPRLQ